MPVYPYITLHPAAGYKSFRQTNLGSWFVRALVKEICEHAHDEHLEDILTRVH